LPYPVLDPGYAARRAAIWGFPPAPAILSDPEVHGLDWEAALTTSPRRIVEARKSGCQRECNVVFSSKETLVGLPEIVRVRVMDLDLPGTGRRLFHHECVVRLFMGSFMGLRIILSGRLPLK